MQGLEGALGRVPETDVASLRQAQRLQDEGALTVRCCEDPRQREEGGAWPHPGPSQEDRMEGAGRMHPHPGLQRRP